MIIISHSYDIEGFKQFIEEIKNQSCGEIIKLSKKELHEVRALKKGDTEYADILRGFLFFIQWGKKPKAISEKEFQLFRPVFESLVENGDHYGIEFMRKFEDDE